MIVDKDCESDDRCADRVLPTSELASRALANWLILEKMFFKPEATSPQIHLRKGSPYPISDEFDETGSDSDD